MLRSGRHRRQSSAAQNRAYAEGKARNRSSTLDTNKEMQIVGKDGIELNREKCLESSKDFTPESAQEDTDMEGLAGAMSALRFVPPSVKFGRGRGKGGFSRT